MTTLINSRDNFCTIWSRSSSSSGYSHPWDPSDVNDDDDYDNHDSDNYDNDDDDDDNDKNDNKHHHQVTHTLEIFIMEIFRLDQVNCGDSALIIFEYDDSD